MVSEDPVFVPNCATTVMSLSGSTPWREKKRKPPSFLVCPVPAFRRGRFRELAQPAKRRAERGAPRVFCANTNDPDEPGNHWSEMRLPLTVQTTTLSSILAKWNARRAAVLRACSGLRASALTAVGSRYLDAGV
jgi:hypothetical protein